MTKQKKFDFEVAMTELEQIVTQLEGENESLEKSLTLFESGIKLQKNFVLIWMKRNSASVF